MAQFGESLKIYQICQNFPCQAFPLYSSPVLYIFHTIYHNFTTLVFTDTSESGSGSIHSSNITKKGWVHNQYKLMNKLCMTWQKVVKLVCTYVQVVDYFTYDVLSLSLQSESFIRWQITKTSSYVNKFMH